MRLTRRQFLEAGAVGSGALVLGCNTFGPAGPAPVGASDAQVFDAWLAITPDDRILVHLDKVEMGQGTASAYATLIGEELRTPPERIALVGAPVDGAYGMQTTGGSNSLSGAWGPLRETGARAREMLRAAAAERLGVSGDGLVVEDGAVADPASGQRLRFGELAAAAAARSAPRNVELTPASEYRFIGKDRPRVDAFEKSTGRATFGIDVRVPELRRAVVVHCPHPKGSLVRFDDSRARDLPGVEDVFEVPGGVAVVATSTFRARRAAQALEVEWDPGASAGVDDAFIAKGLADALDGELNENVDDGDVEAAVAAADRTIDAEYRLPFLAHATMEPMNCTIVPNEDGIDVYQGTQAPGVIQDVVAHILDRSRDDVRVHVTYLGGGFGRRAFPDMAADAAEIVKRTDKPIQLVWSREDDMARDYYRPPSLHRLKGGLDAEGAIVAWDHALAVPSLLPDMGGIAGALVPQWARSAAIAVGSWATQRIPGWLGPILGIEGASHLPYAVANQRLRSVAWDAGIPVGIWRSVGHSHNGFVVESFVDELAVLAGEDPAAFRRARYADQPRHLAVLDRLVDASGWGKAAPGRFQGIAVHESFGSVAGEVAEVSVENGEIRVHRVTAVVHVGRAVNPDVVRAQVESGILFGLTATLFGEIHFRDGAAVESNFHDHRMLRLAEAPEIDVHIVPSEDDPTGIGEPGTPPIAPAVANAVYAATGERLRALPLRPTA